MAKQISKQRINRLFKTRINDITILLNKWKRNPEEIDTDLGNLNEYGSGFYYDYDDDEGAGYFLYLLSWGGPADGFKFYTDPDYNIYKIVYYMQDWNEYGEIPLTGPNLKLMKSFWYDFITSEGAAYVHKKYKKERG